MIRAWLFRMYHAPGFPSSLPAFPPPLPYLHKNTKYNISALLFTHICRTFDDVLFSGRYRYQAPSLVRLRGAKRQGDDDCLFPWLHVCGRRGPANCVRFFTFGIPPHGLR